MKDFAGPAGEVSAYGPGVVSPAVVQDGDGRRDVRSLAKAPPVQYIEGKVWQISRINGFKYVLGLEAVYCTCRVRTQISFKTSHCLFSVDIIISVFHFSNMCRLFLV